MSRPGVTYQDIVSAVNKLKEKGKNITIENIRVYLGTGSIATINKYLRQWRETNHSISNSVSQAAVPDELVSVLKGLWDRVITQSAEQFTSVEEALLNEIAGLKQELEKYKSNNQRWQKLFNQWQQEKTELDKAKLTLEQALDFAHKENAAMTIKHDSLYQQLQEKQERIYELNRLHKLAQENLAYFRDSVREQRLQEQQKFEQEKNQYLLTIKKLNDELMLRKDQLALLQSDHQVLQTTHKTLEAATQQNLSKLDKLSEKLEDSEKSKTVFEKDAAHWQSESDNLKNQLKEKIEQASEIQAELKAQLKALTEQNKLLANDRWILGQEKAQLEGQLKHLQTFSS